MKRLWLLLIFVGLIASACNFEQVTEIYTQDMLEVRDSGETIHNSATVTIEFSGDADDRAQVEALLKPHLTEVGNVRNEMQGNTSYLVLDYKVPLAVADDTESAYQLAEVRGNIFTFVIIGDTLNIAFNSDRFKALDTALYEHYRQHLEFENFTMRVTLHNDLRDPVEVTLYSVYVDNAPVPYSMTVVAERRDRLDITFSDVLRDSTVMPDESETTAITLRKFAEFKLPAE